VFNVGPAQSAQSRTKLVVQRGCKDLQTWSQRTADASSRPVGMLGYHLVLRIFSSNPSRRPSSSPNTSRNPTSRPSRRTSTTRSASRNAAPSCSSARRLSRRSTSRTTSCRCPRRRHATIPARRLGSGGRVLDKRCVGREESGIDVGRGVLSGHVAIGVVLGVGRGESFGAGEGLWCWCL
jgi:hypothetical protein